MTPAAWTGATALLIGLSSGALADSASDTLDRLRAELKNSQPRNQPYDPSASWKEQKAEMERQCNAIPDDILKPIAIRMLKENNIAMLDMQRSNCDMSVMTDHGLYQGVIQIKEMNESRYVILHLHPTLE
jgi:hypothetical protein